MSNLPTITKNLLIINVLCFLANIVCQRYDIDLNNVFGLHFFIAENFQFWQLFTYMFMHANWEHIFFNMFAVWMFGRTLEYVWGSRRFLSYYLICGVGAGLTQEGVQYIEYATQLASYSGVDFGSGTIPMDAYLNMMNTVGASGAIYGVLLAFGLLFPDNRLFVFPIPVPIKAKWFVVGYAAIELLMGISTTRDGVAHFAHLGGMLFGLIYILCWKHRQARSRSKVYFESDGARKEWQGLKKTSWQGLVDWFRKKAKRRPSMKYHFHEAEPKRDAELERVLAKLRQTGYEGLTEEEKQKLFDMHK
ncbi:MAG: rhomboid family intramembrane serine protease [Bacteroidales bacterium]|nr:rhomboid family intramembrane serine protease [Bacteroidales bacterium]